VGVPDFEEQLALDFLEGYESKLEPSALSLKYLEAAAKSPKGRNRAISRME
jgi:hypothetical protein